MATYVETATKTFVAAAALGDYLRVKDNGSGKVVVAGAGEDDLGTTEIQTFAADDRTSVRMWNAMGTRKIKLSGSVAKFGLLYGAASGKVSATVAGKPKGYAMAAGVDGDTIEMLPIVTVLAQGDALVVEHHATGDTLTVRESGSLHTNVGAGAAIVLALPPATVGLEYLFCVGAVQELRIDPDGTETISLPSTGVPMATGKYLTANAIGETVHLVCAIAGSWAVMGYTGTWTAEP